MVRRKEGVCVIDFKQVYLCTMYKVLYITFASNEADLIPLNPLQLYNYFRPNRPGARDNLLML